MDLLPAGNGAPVSATVPSALHLPGNFAFPGRVQAPVIRYHLANILLDASIAQLLVLVASSLVPIRLDWNDALKDLAPGLRQLFWVYGGYVVLSILGLGTISLFNSVELTAGNGLAGDFCA